jgi:hypothetical protein
MPKNTYTKRKGNAALILAAAIIGASWMGTDYVNAQLKTLPIHELRQLDTKQDDNLPVSYYGAWAHAPAKGGPQDPMPADFEDVFQKKDEPKADSLPTNQPMVAAPKNSDLLRQSLELDSVSDNGAVINGVFTAVGSPIESHGLMSSSGQGVMTLRSVGPKSITVTLADEQIEINLPVPGERN